ncbi:T9SS type A sorting domain-containing protein [Hymenobacter chitinivorans]|uniref:Putative secreted protein (Por secretion system target) n=1 Tax=Hymenobacter chitinivorans DSM 11115 TaxID=1121954 RepID=A0A2M9B517_9BACT|nr:T9SS type A sorting domain-containing protein [Hymenobacter chitinivorans]PJJ53016.1 putative secreted protein (Por secretion system target) [Hymenobacter chitinivorans DSM 11115]
MKQLLYSLLALGLAHPAAAQLSGTKTIDPAGSGPSNYPTFTAAITALNAGGVGADGVLFQVKSGAVFAEIAPAITVSGTATGRIIFLKDGSGANPKLQGVGTGATDAGLTLDGADYVTINGIDVVDAATNTTAAQQLEYGFWLKNGATNNLVQNSTVDLNRANTTKTSGVFMQDGNNNLNRFLSNTIQDCFYGYNLDAGSTNYDNGNEIGMLAGGAPSRVLTIGAGAANVPTGVVYGIYLRSQTAAKVGSTEVSGLTGTSSVYGIYSTGTGNTADIFDNRVHALTATNSSGAAQGIYVNSGLTHSIYRNYTYDIAATGATGFASGMDITAGTTNNVYNNFVYDIRALASTAGTSVRALSFRGGTNNYCYHNTVVLTGAPTAASNKSGAFYISGTPPVDLRNNIFVNLITLPSGGGGVAAAFFKSTAVLTNLAAASNNNLFYAGTPAAEKPIFYGVATTPAVDQTLAQYKLRAAPADQSAVTENVPFVNPLTDPHLQAGAATQAESSGQSLVNSPLPVPTDIDNAARTVATPDLGADEGSFQVIDITGPSIAYQPLPSTASAGNRSLSVVITDPSGVASGATTGPRLYYKKKTDANVFTEPNDATGNGWKWVAPGPAPTTSYIFTLDVSKLRSVPAPGDSIQYFVTAQDLAATPNVSASPGAGFAATSVASITSAPTKPSAYKILGLLSGIKTVGTAATADYPTLTAAVADLNSKELGGALTLVLQDASYPTETYPLTLSANTGSSATNAITIRPAALRAVTLAANATTPLFIIDASYVTLEGLSPVGNSGSLALTNAGTAASSGGIFVTGRDVTLRGLSIQGSSSATAYGVAFSGATNGTVRGCLITRTSTGIQAQSNCVNFTAAGNTIGSTTTAADKIGTSGIVITATQGFAVNNNTITGITRAVSPSVAGIVVGTTSVDGVIAANQIRDIVHTGTGISDSYGAYGIRLSASGAAANVAVVNNMISDILSSGDDGISFTPQGVYMSTGGGYKLGFNTIRLTGNIVSGTTPTTGAVTVASGVTDVSLVNNILVNQQTATPTGGRTYAVYAAGTTSPFTLIDNNAYSTQGATAKLAYLNGAERTTLAALRAATVQDASSLLANPVFTLTTAGDLHLSTDSNCNLDGKARAVAGVTLDIDNNVRNTSTPDIGADEFTATARLAPTAPNKFGFLNQTIPNLTATTAAGGTAVWYNDAALTQRLFAGPSYATGRTAVGTYTYYVVDSLNACVSPATTVRLNISGPDATVAALRDLSISCYPNPAHGTVTLQVEGPARTISAQLLDALGRPVLQQTVRHDAPATQHPLNLQGLAKGIYLLRLTTEGQTTGRRIVVE